MNNNISPLPFYDDLSYQNHRKDYAFGQPYMLAAPKSLLLPFQVVLDAGESVSSAVLYTWDDGSQQDITTQMKEAGLGITAYDGFSMLKYPAYLPLVGIKHEGTHYLAITVDGYGTVYSDLFAIVFNMDGYLELEYRNSYSFELSGGMVDFSDPQFKFRCYLQTQLGRPDYEFEEEATERMSYSFMESQVSKKVYKFTFLAPEYLCDALRIVRMCDYKVVRSKGLEYEATQFTMDVDWQDQGDIAAVECELETDTVIANVGGYQPEPLGGDYNADYDNDYLVGDESVTTITIRLSASSSVSGMVTATAGSNVKSVLTITVDYTYGSSSTAATGTVVMAKGSTVAILQTGRTNVSITSASVSQDESDGTKYELDY